MGHNVIGIRSMRLCHQSGTAGTLTKPSWFKSVSGSGKSQGTFGNHIARLRVSRVVTVIDAGRMVNPRTARNQIEGAVVMGVGHGDVRSHRVRPAERRT